MLLRLTTEGTPVTWSCLLLPMTTEERLMPKLDTKVIPNKHKTLVRDLRRSTSSRLRPATNARPPLIDTKMLSLTLAFFLSRLALDCGTDSLANPADWTLVAMEAGVVVALWGALVKCNSRHISRWFRHVVVLINVLPLWTGYCVARIFMLCSR